MKLAGIYPYVALLIIAFISALIMLKLRTQSEKQPPEPWVRAYAYAYEKDSGIKLPGVVALKAFKAWDEEEIVFVDFGFNGTLDGVRIPYKSGEAIDPNSPDWEMWLERYYKVRDWATTGEKPQL